MIGIAYLDQNGNGFTNKEPWVDEYDCNYKDRVQELIQAGYKNVTPFHIEDDLESPIDHIAYAALDPNNEFRVILDKDNMYFHDEDGYNFTNRNFC